MQECFPGFSIEATDGSAGCGNPDRAVFDRESPDGIFIEAVGRRERFPGFPVEAGYSGWGSDPDASFVVDGEIANDVIRESVLGRESFPVGTVQIAGCQTLIGSDPDASGMIVNGKAGYEITEQTVFFIGLCNGIPAVEIFGVSAVVDDDAVAVGADPQLVTMYCIGTHIRVEKRIFLGILEPACRGIGRRGEEKEADEAQQKKKQQPA